MEKMRAHENSECHVRASEAVLVAASKEGTVLQQLQSIGIQERAKNRAAIKSLIRCTHFLTRQHIAHSTNFSKLVDLILSCGAQDLKVFTDNAAKNATYTSRAAVVDFIEALGTWVEEKVVQCIHKASVFSLMADKCTVITTVEEFSVFCHWEESGTPVECFLDIIPLKKVDAESIYLALLQCLRDKNMQIGRMVGMGFDGASTFSGKKTGVQARLRQHAPHAVFVPSVGLCSGCKQH